MGNDKENGWKREDELAKSWGHLVGEGASNDHAIGLARAGPEDDSEPVQIVTGRARVHHLHRAAGQPKRHGPDGPHAGPVHERVDLRDYELRRLRQPHGGGLRRRSRRTITRRSHRSGGTAVEERR